MLGIFAIAAAVIACFSLAGVGLMYGIYGVIFIDGVASIFVLMVCSAIFWFTKVDWRKPEATAIMISFMSFVGMCLDSRGNPIYNQPFAWLLGSRGSHLQIKEIVTHGGGSTGVNYEFQVINLYGANERTISGWFVIPLRFVEYLIVLSIAATIITVIRNRSGRNWLPDNARE